MPDHSIVPVYVFILLSSVAFVSFQLGRRFCGHGQKVEYRYIPRSHEELEQNTSASDALRNFV